MNIIDRIQDNFAKGYFGKSMQIPELPQEWQAWTLKQDGWIGVKPENISDSRNSFRM